MSALAIPEVTLCCIDCTPRLPWALKAIQRCLDSASFADVLLFTDCESLGTHRVPTGVRWVETEPLRSIEAYSTYVLKSLGPHIRSSHALVVQWDGFILNAAAWRDEFLAYDYIGAPWLHIAEPNSVGNGGFSLRSARLLQALQAPAIVATHPEDICICVTHRRVLLAQGLRFAPVDVARQFAVEEGALSPSVFGFHGPYHLPNVLSPDETLAFVESLSPQGTFAAHYFGMLLNEMTRAARRDARQRPALAAFERLIGLAIDRLDNTSALSPAALGACKALIRYGQFKAADRLLYRRREASGRWWSEPKLRMRLQANALIASIKRP